MSATTPSTSLDLSSTSSTPFLRLVRVELRKARDTRAGLWLLISIAALCALIMVIQLSIGIAQESVSLTYNSFLGGASLAIGILLPVVGILLVTSEWGQRTAMVTFSLEPRRAHVIVAKLAVGVVLSVLAVAVAMVLGAISNLLYAALSTDSIVWNLDLPHAGSFFLLQLIGMLTGFAFATLLLNSAAAIVVYMAYTFVLPGIFAIGAGLLAWFDKIRPWIDFANAQANLPDAAMTSKDWAHFAVSGFIWLVLPLAIGIWRVLRAEVK